MFLNGDRFHNQETMRMAEIIRARREIDLQGRIHGLSCAYNRRSNFIAYMKLQGKKKLSRGTQQNWESAIAKLCDFAEGEIVFGDITRSFVENFKDYLIQKVKASTAEIYHSKFRAALRQAVKDGIINVSPAEGVFIKVEESLPVFLSLDEIKKLATTKSNRKNTSNAFLFGCFTGLRYSDIKKLELKDIRDGYIEFRQMKTKNAERLPLSSQAKKILEEQNGISGNREGLVFHLPHRNSVNTWLRNWAKRAGIGKRISFHKSRHTFATLALTVGVDLYTTSKLLGHRDLKTTQIYAKVVDEKKQQAVDMLPVI